MKQTRTHARIAYDPGLVRVRVHTIYSRAHRVECDEATYS